MKRSQISFFVVISLIIVIFFFFLLNVNMTEKTGVLDSEIVDETEFYLVKDYFQNCLDTAAKDSVYWIGTEGGYSEYFGYGVPFYLLNVPVYYNGNNDTITILDSDFVEGEINKAVNIVFSNCLGNYSNLGDLGYNISFNKSNENIITNVYDSSVEFMMPEQYGVEYKGKKVSFSGHKSSVNVELPRFLNTVNEYVKEQSYFDDSILLSKLSSLSVRENMVYEYFSPNENQVIFKFIFNGYEYMGENFYWNFAVEYDWG